MRNNADFVKNSILYGFVENKPIKLQNKSLNIMQLEKQLYGFMFVYDASEDDRQSFREVRTSIKYISEYCEKKAQKSGGLITQKILVANKIDLIDKEKQNKLAESVKEVTEAYSMHFVKTSAYSGYNCTLAFEELGKLIKKDIKMEMKGNDWLKEIGNEIIQIEELLLKESKKKYADMGTVAQATGLFGCGARDKQDNQDSDEEQDEYDQEDDEFTNLPFWNQSMNETQDGCRLF